MILAAEQQESNDGGQFHHRYQNKIGTFSKHFNVEYRTQRANLFRSLPQHYTADITVMVYSKID